MYYSIRHMTRFRYSEPVSQSFMELRMQPRSDTFQRCLSFRVAIHPKARTRTYGDYLGNTVHHFDIPGQHKQLTIAAEALVEMRDFDDLPESLPPESWQALDTLAHTDYDMVLPSPFTHSTELLEALARELRVERRDDPMSLLRELNTAIFKAFDYELNSTKVDSPIDDALTSRQGVCQDFSHIMIALVRGLGIPARYVSGYLFQRKANNRIYRSAEDASHAWVEALLPQVGWVGFDPTNNVICGARHIRVAIGRDYSDVPPTRGVFKGSADTELSVGVQVSEVENPPDDISMNSNEQWPAMTTRETVEADEERELQEQAQQQQQ